MTNQPQLLALLIAACGTLLAADAPKEMWDADLSGGLAFVFGAEGRGLRPLVRRTCDDAVRIPLAGLTESLNVSVAAALLLYEARRQRSRG